ncbi:unnamed protein product, partial [Iphiclides podalirius]
MTDEIRSISARTWMRTVDSISKVGYSDGVNDGEANTYQTSFDSGYEQGINFGFHLGIMDAKAQDLPTQNVIVRDRRSINCQICLNESMGGNTGNLFNLQKDKNDDFLEIIESKSFK